MNVDENEDGSPLVLRLNIESGLSPLLSFSNPTKSAQKVR